MNLALTSREAFVEGLARACGADPLATQEGLAEMVRAEVAALGVGSRHGLAGRVAALLRPAGEVDVARVVDVIRLLEETGDLVGGPGGKVVGAPLLLIRVGPGRHLVVGGGPSGPLREKLGMQAGPGLVRQVRGAPDGDGALAAVLASLGGRCIPLETWAGLDRVPPAGPEWMEMLAARLGDRGEEEFAVPEGAEVYEAGRRKWQRWAGGEGPVLLRGRQPGGWYLYGWMGAGSGGRLIGLDRDGARRTVLTLEREAGVSPAVRATPSGGWVELSVPTVLPYAEYRYVLGLAERLDWEGFPVRYRVAVADVARVAACLAQRLGLLVDQVEGS